MAKRIYQVGEPCDECGVPTVAGKDGTGYCKPCYIKWKNTKEAMPPAQGGYAPKQWAGAQKTVANQTSDNINRFESRQQESMRTLAAGRDATLIVVAEMGQGNAWTEDDIKKRVKMWAGWIKATIYDVPFVG